MDSVFRALEGHSNNTFVRRQAPYRNQRRSCNNVVVHLFARRKGGPTSTCAFASEIVAVLRELENSLVVKSGMPSCARSLLEGSQGLEGRIGRRSGDEGCAEPDRQGF